MGAGSNEPLFCWKVIMGEEGKPTIFCPEDVVAFEDFAFVCEYASRCSGRMEKLPFDGYFYCKHKGSSSTGIYTAREIRHALQPVLAVGEKMGAGFTAHKLQYAFRFMAFWYFHESFQRFLIQKSSHVDSQKTPCHRPDSGKVIGKAVNQKPLKKGRPKEGIKSYRG